MENNDIINALALFFRDETLEQCPISIVSREDIEGEPAELVWFVWGEEKHKCPAVVWVSGSVFTPLDWEENFDPVFKIEDCLHWMDCNFARCVMFMGMPRIIL